MHTLTSAAPPPPNTPGRPKIIIFQGKNLHVLYIRIFISQNTHRRRLAPRPGRRNGTGSSHPTCGRARPPPAFSRWVTDWRGPPGGGGPYLGKRSSFFNRRIFNFYRSHFAPGSTPASTCHKEITVFQGEESSLSIIGIFI